jgi:hypothetical protein
MSRIAIFGIGPSGLAAAAAVLRAGRCVDLFSKRLEKSQLFGCQYLHAPIFGYTHHDPITVDYTMIGTPEDYRRKVYGDDWNGKVSPEDFEGRHKAWDIRLTYANLWNDIMLRGDGSVRVRGVNITARWIQENQALLSTYASVISTIPADYICYQEHDFRSHVVWASGTTEPGSDETAEIVCDGTRDVDWYRKSSVFGYRTIEWPTKPEGIPAARVVKPLRTNCGCFPSIIRMGRYGRWQKGILVHQVYQQAEYLMSLLNNDVLDTHICRVCGRWGEGSRNELVFRCTEGHIWGS